MKITLIEKGKNVKFLNKTIKITRDKKIIFESDIITGHMFRKSLELKEKQENLGLSEDLLNEIGQFVCEVFGHQFTLQDLYDGLIVEDILMVFNNVIMKVIGATTRYQKH